MNSYFIKTIENDSFFGIKPKVLREIMFLRNVKHKHIAKLIGISHSSTMVHIYLEHYGRTLLDIPRNQLIRDSNIITETLENTVRHIHSKNYIHGDINFSNILEAEKTYKLIDFGNAIRKHRISALGLPVQYVADPTTKIGITNINHVDTYALKCVRDFITNGKINLNISVKQTKYACVNSLYNNTDITIDLIKFRFRTINEILLALTIKYNIPIECIFITTKLLEKNKNKLDTTTENAIILFSLVLKLLTNNQIPLADIAKLISSEDTNDKIYVLLDKLDWNIDCENPIEQFNGHEKTDTLVNHIFVELTSLFFRTTDRNSAIDFWKNPFQKNHNNLLIELTREYFKLIGV